MANRMESSTNCVLHRITELVPGFGIVELPKSWRKDKTSVTFRSHGTAPGSPRKRLLPFAVFVFYVFNKKKQKRKEEPVQTESISLFRFCSLFFFRPGLRRIGSTIASMSPPSRSHWVSFSIQNFHTHTKKQQKIRLLRNPFGRRWLEIRWVKQFSGFFSMPLRFKLLVSKQFFMILWRILYYF